MSQQTVALIVERLLTDRNFRNEFALEPLDTLFGVEREGLELTSDESVALVQADMRMWFWPDEAEGLDTLRNVLVAFEKSRARQSSLNATARTAASPALPAWNESDACLPDFHTALDSERTAVPIQASVATTRGDRVTALVPALSSVEEPRYRVFDGNRSPADDSSPFRLRRGFRWLLLALICFVLAFVVGFATGIARAAQDTPRFRTKVVEERACVTCRQWSGIIRTFLAAKSPDLAHPSRAS